MLIPNLLLGVVAVDITESLSRIPSLLAFQAKSAVDTYTVKTLSVGMYTLSVITISFLSRGTLSRRSSHNL